MDLKMLMFNRNNIFETKFLKCYVDNLVQASKQKIEWSNAFFKFKQSKLA